MRRLSTRNRLDAAGFAVYSECNPLRSRRVQMYAGNCMYSLCMVFVSSRVVLVCVNSIILKWHVCM